MNFVSLVLSGDQLNIKNESTGLRVWTRLSPISADITSPTETANHPLAGTAMQIVSVDTRSRMSNIQAAKVIMPAYLALHVIATDQSTVESIRAAHANTELTFSVTTRNIVSDAMSLTEVEIDQSADNINGVSMTLTFEQTSISEQNPFKPRQAADESTNGISTKEPKTITGFISSLYNKVKSSIGF